TTLFRSRSVPHSQHRAVRSCFIRVPPPRRVCDGWRPLGSPFGEEVVARTRHRCPKMPGCRGLGKVPVGVTACPFSPYFWVEKPWNSTPGTVRPSRVLHRGGHITQAHD